VIYVIRSRINFTEKVVKHIYSPVIFAPGKPKPERIVYVLYFVMHWEFANYPGNFSITNHFIQTSDDNGNRQPPRELADAFIAATWFDFKGLSSDQWYKIQKRNNIKF